VKAFTVAVATVAAIAATALPAAAGTKTILLKDDVFSPKSLTVRKGASLKLKWAGHHPHNLVGGGVRTATKTHGSTTVKFKKKGSFTLVCQIHSGMKMKLKVK
jgi:plastocyanin